MKNQRLPERPDLGQLRRQARELQRQGAADKATLPLHEAQLALARAYGFGSWARLRHHVEAINARTFSHQPAAGDELPSATFLRLACLTYADDANRQPAEAAEFLTAHPELTETNIAVAAVCARTDLVERALALDPTAATTTTAPYGWSPLMYFAYSRLDVPEDKALKTARMLLDAGADPNDGRFFAGLAMPFTVLTGVFGGGEQNQPAHPHALKLGRLLLERGAEPNDGQTLYNCMFVDDDAVFELLFAAGLGRGEGGPWRELLPDLLDPPAVLLQGPLSWALDHDQRSRVALLASNGVDVVAKLPTGKTPIETALANGNQLMARMLRELGASEPELDPVATFIAAALAGDEEAVVATAQDTIAAARRTRPSLIVWAAGQGRPDAVRLLASQGFDVNALGRSDVQREQPWQTALHAAVERDDLPMARTLLDLGADTQLRDKRFDGTPRDWADHLGRPQLAALLDEPHA